MKKNYTIRHGLFVSAIFAIAVLRGQQSYTFTNCGATGSVGPTQTQVNTAYFGTNLVGLVTTTISGIQTWTAPYSGNFRIEARGAQGGTSTSTGGLGATMRGDFALISGEVIQILVGQQGDAGSSTQPGGGGGGSFVVRAPYTTTNSILVIAGGGTGGGAYSDNPGLSTSAGGTGGVAGGTNGSGGLGGIRGAGGGGFLTDGAPCSASTTYASPGQAFVNGGRGGPATNNPTCGFIANGGYGGGSSGGGFCFLNGGAGGGFSGGGGSSNSSSGGGGSLNQGTNQLNVSGNNSGNGRVIITELCNISIMSSSSGTANASICAGNSLTLTTTAVSNYSWSTGQTSSSIVVAPTTNTFYSITGTSSLACTATGVMNVTVSLGLPVLSINNPSNTICLGASATLIASGAVTYSWSGGVQNGIAFIPSATQTFTVTGQNGCGISTSTTAIIAAPLSVTVQATPTLVCQGYPAILSASSSVGGYTWQPMGVAGQSITISPTVNTVYTVTASDGTCSGVATLSILTKETPTVTASGSSSMACANSTIGLNAAGAVNYSWTPVNLSGQNIVVTPSISTLYQVAGTNSVGCTSFANWVVIVSPAPTVTATSDKPLVCVGGMAVLTASGAISFSWAGGPSTTVFSVNPVAASVYTVVGFGPSGCTSTKTVSVNVYIPVIAVTPASSSICPGDQKTLSGSGATTYSWNGTGGTAQMVFTPSTSTVYVLTANTSSAGITCSASASASITVFPAPTISIAATKTTLCKGESPALLTASGGTVYAWSNSATTSTIFALSNSASTLVYSVTASDANGCEGTSSIQVKVNGCVGIADKNLSQNGFQIYPNPNSGDFVISSTEELTLKLIDNYGRELKVLSLNAGNDHKVNLNEIANGIYFIIGENGGTSSAYKIIVQR